MPNPKDTKEELESRTKEQLLDYVYDLHKSLMACGIYSVPMFGVADAVQQGTHFPGCHKAHIECANKKIDEVTAHIKGIEHCSKMFEFETIQRRLISWLESLGVDE